jgi:D-xylose reductase
MSEEGSKVEYGKASLESTWKAMEAAQKKGLTKSIGISNYTGNLLLDLFTYAEIKPATLQIEHHPYLVQPKLLELANENGIVVTGYSSFGPQSFVDGDMAFAKDIPLLFDHEVIKKVADAHSKTTAQVLLRWATQRGLAVIPKSSSQTRLEQNLDVTSFDLSDEEIKEISGLDKGLRFNAPLNVCRIFFTLKMSNKG